jgi:hypothetical protein
MSKLFSGAYRNVVRLHHCQQPQPDCHEGCEEAMQQLVQVQKIKTSCFPLSLRPSPPPLRHVRRRTGKTRLPRAYKWGDCSFLLRIRPARRACKESQEPPCLQKLLCGTQISNAKPRVFQNFSWSKSRSFSGNLALVRLVSGIVLNCYSIQPKHTVLSSHLQR